MTRMHELAEFLKSHDDYCVLGHIYPDGDACGSAIAIARALIRLGKRTFVYIPGGIPHSLQCFEAGVAVASDKNLPFEPQTALALDTADKNRLGDGLAIFEVCPHRAVLDHHGTNPGYGEVCMIDGRAAATGELAVELIRELGVAPDAGMAMWLYIALATDSGQFGFSCTRAETLNAAAECVRAGIDPDDITRRLFRLRTEGHTRLLGLVLSEMRRSEDGKICWSRATDDMFERAGAKREDNDNIVNYLVEVEGVCAACLAEQRGAQTKLSLRAVPPYNVAASVAVPLGGGGHPGAAGATLDAPMDEALRIVLPRMRAMIDAAKENA